MAHVSEVISRQLVGATRAEASGMLDDIYDSLVVGIDVRKLPENIFVRDFLPYFAGVKPITTRDKVLATWFTISGGATASVHIVDNHDANKILFTVPGLINTSVINVTDREMGKSLCDIMQMYRLQKEVLPQIGEAYLNRATEDRAKSIATIPVDMPVNQSVWATIFSRYNLGTRHAATATVNATQHEELSYD